MASVVRRIVLIACARQKLSRPAKARELYTSPLFKLNFSYAESLKPDEILILSAKYGLVRPEKEVPPYDETLNTLSRAGIHAWATGVLSQLFRVADLERDEFIFLAGERYRKFIVPDLKHVQVPLEGLSIGKQLQFLKRALAT